MTKSRFSRFPDPLLSDSQSGVLCHGGNLDTETLLDAYGNGIFPWPHEGYPMLWFSPKKRGIIQKLHYPKSFLKFKKSQEIKFTIDKDFKSVLEFCSVVPRKGQDGTWINSQIKQAYLNFHKDGFAHSFEGWDQEGKLVCGLYGVYVAGSFSAESMFGLKSNTSKLALAYAIEWLQQQGLEWIDVQMVTPVIKSFGGEYIGQKKYLKLLTEASRSPVDINWTQEKTPKSL